MSICPRFCIFTVPNGVYVIVSTEVLLWITFLNLFAWSGTDKPEKQNSGILFSAKICPCVYYHENPRQTPGEVSTSEGSTSVDMRPVLVWGWRVTETSSRAAPTWLDFLNLFVIHPTQRL